MSERRYSGVYYIASGQIVILESNRQGFFR